MAAGATGYLQKYSGGRELEETTRAIAEGRLRIPEEALRRTLAMVRGKLREKTHRGPGVLTDQERELLALFARGDGNQSGDSTEYDLPRPGQAGTEQQA